MLDSGKIKKQAQDGIFQAFYQFPRLLYSLHIVNDEEHEHQDFHQEKQIRVGKDVH
jgi:hypothetical protein